MKFSRNSASNATVFKPFQAVKRGLSIRLQFTSINMYKKMFVPILLLYAGSLCIFLSSCNQNFYCKPLHFFCPISWMVCTSVSCVLAVPPPVPPTGGTGIGTWDLLYYSRYSVQCILCACCTTSGIVYSVFCVPALLLQVQCTECILCACCTTPGIVYSVSCVPAVLLYSMICVLCTVLLQELCTEYRGGSHNDR